jgi:hypothetical protein
MAEITGPCLWVFLLTFPGDVRLMAIDPPTVPEAEKQ